MKSRSQKFIILGITFIIMAILGVFLIWPVFSSIWSSWKTLNQTKTDLKVMEEKKQILAQLEEKTVTSVADIAEKYIPKESESGQLVIELAAMAQANNLKVEQTSLEKSKTSKTSEETTSEKATPTPSAAPTVSPSGGGSKFSFPNDVKTVDFSMTVNGNFSDFLNFLKTIETSSRLIALKNLTLQQKANSDKTTSFTAQITGVAFYKKDLTIDKDKIESLKIPDEAFQKFLNLKTYGQPIDLPTESGFGRNNPFEGY